MKKSLIVANWKANPPTIKDAQKISVGIKKSVKRNQEVVICAPFIFAPVLKESGFSLGAQTVSSLNNGPFTGEVTASMLKSVGIRYCIVGHSERRKMGETSGEVSIKIKNLLKQNITPIVCVGEAMRGHDGEHFNEIKTLLTESLGGISKKMVGSIVIAYEPLWAISTEKKGFLEPEIINETILFIKKELRDMYGMQASKNISIIYGGSVDEKNAKHILEKGGAEGLLIGKASQKLDTFKKIIENLN